MLRSIERGLPLCEWENITIGMILDFKITYDNEHLEDDEKEDSVRMANQKDFDHF